MPPVPSSVDAALVAAVAARMVAVVVVGTRCLPDIGHAVRLLVALVLTAAAVPTAAGAMTGPPPALLVAGELVVGLGLGLAAASVGSAAAWAGTLLGSVSGLTWADEFGADGDVEAAGASRLAWWLGLAGWCAAGGPLAAVAAAVDSVVSLPIGCLCHGDGPAAAFVSAVTAMPAVASGLALSLALPALTAVVAFHVASAICLRTIRIDPGAGLLQAGGALVLVVGLLAGLGHWTTGWGETLTTLAEECRRPAAAASGSPAARMPDRPEAPRG